MNEEVGFGKQTIVINKMADFGGAILEIATDKKTDTIFHRLNGKLVYVLAGIVQVSVIQDGQIKSIVVRPGNSFYIKPGLPYTFEGKQHAILVEFANNDVYNKDKYVLFMGTPLEKSNPKAESGEFAKMVEEDIIKINEELEVEKKEKPKRTRCRKSKKTTVTK